jgi:hypothetical protein
MGIAFGIFIVHASYAEDSYSHRRFPRNFTFGAITSLILYFLVNSILITVVGAISFFTHLLGDGHLDEAIMRDEELRRSIRRKIKTRFRIE